MTWTKPAAGDPDPKLEEVPATPAPDEDPAADDVDEPNEEAPAKEANFTTPRLD